MNLRKISKDTLTSQIWSKFKNNKPALYSIRCFIFVVFIGVFADFIANDKPIVCKYKGRVYFPVFQSYAVSYMGSKWHPDMALEQWKSLDYQWVLWTLIPYGAKEIDRENFHYTSPFDQQVVVKAEQGGKLIKDEQEKKQRVLTFLWNSGEKKQYQIPMSRRVLVKAHKPFDQHTILTNGVPSWRWRHWLGTDEIGRDVLSGLINGTRTALLVGVVAMSIAGCIGVFLGAIAGYFGDYKVRVPLINIIWYSFFLGGAFFYTVIMRTYDWSIALSKGMFFVFIQLAISMAFFMVATLLAYVFSSISKYIPIGRKQVSIPLDIFISRMIEVIISIPTLLLILAIIATLQSPSIFWVMVIIGFTGWTGIARLIRGETLKVKNLNYIEAAKAMGFSQIRIILRHALPNSLTPVLISVAFGIAGAILTESALSFLGIGVSPEDITWGKLLSLGRENPSAWWLAIFPGIAIFITVTICNLIGEGLTDALDPKTN